MARSSLPNSSSKYQLFQAYVGSDGGEQPLFVLPPNYNPYQPSSPVVLPQLWSLAQSYGGPDPNNADFAFALNQGSAAITLLGANMWAGDSGARQTLRKNFTSFLAAIETDIDAKGFLIPGSTHRIGQLI